MNDSENKKSFEELADEALENVAGGRSVLVQDCVICHKSYYAIGSDGNAYCYTHYKQKYPNG